MQWVWKETPGTSFLSPAECQPSAQAHSTGQPHLNRMPGLEGQPCLPGPHCRFMGLGYTRDHTVLSASFISIMPAALRRHGKDGEGVCP